MKNPPKLRPRQGVTSQTGARAWIHTPLPVWGLLVICAVLLLLVKHILQVPGVVWWWWRGGWNGGGGWPGRENSGCGTGVWVGFEVDWLGRESGGWAHAEAMAMVVAPDRRHVCVCV